MPFPVTVVYSPRPRTVLEFALVVEAGCTAAQAVQRCDLLAQMTDAELAAADLGIWGRRVNSSHHLRANDRVELYRPLKVDPKVARRERFVRQGARSAGLFAKRRSGAKAGY
jgi:putative ubiquitin-RnfH superfamily antitoxin RatB of RatAB toxin-antitoxin module